MRLADVVPFSEPGAPFSKPLMMFGGRSKFAKFGRLKNVALGSIEKRSPNL